MSEILTALVELILAPVAGAVLGLALGLFRFAYICCKTIFGYDKPIDCKGQNFIVTGGAGGFGVAVTKRLLALGGNVWAVDIVPDDKALEALGKKSVDEDNFHYRRVDLTDMAAMQRFVIELRQKKISIYGLLNNAGIAVPTAACETTQATLNRVMGINFNAACELSRLLFDQQSENCLFKCSAKLCSAGQAPTRSRIVNITSVAGLMTSGGMPSYFASKFALEAWSDATRIEMGEKYLDVAIVEPYFADTHIYGNLLNTTKEQYSKEASILADRLEANQAKFKNAISHDKLMTADFVAERIVAALISARPQDRYLVTPRKGVELPIRFAVHFPNFFCAVDKIKRSAANQDTV